MMSPIRYYTGAVLLGLTLLWSAGCQSHTPVSPSTGEEQPATSLALQLSILQDGATPTLLRSQSPADPQGSEGKVTGMSLWLQHIGTLQGDLSGSGREWSGRFSVPGITAPTERRYAVMLNPNGLSLGVGEDPTEKVVSISQLPSLISADGFTITGTAGSLTVKPYIREPKQPDDNFIPKEGSLDVERVVSKAQLYLKQGYETKDLHDGTLKGLHWATAGGGKTVYLFRNHAGTSNKMADDNGLYKGLTTASAKDKTAGSYQLMKVSDYAAREDGKLKLDGDGFGYVEGTTNFAWKELTTTASGLKSTPQGIYFLEHALKETKGKGQAYSAQVTYKDIAYAKVYADLTDPKGVIGLNKEHHKELAEYGEDVFSLKSLITDTKEKANANFDKSKYGASTLAELTEDPDSSVSGIGTDYADLKSPRWYWIDVDLYVSKKSYWYKHLRTSYQKDRFRKGPGVPYSAIYNVDRRSRSSRASRSATGVKQVNHEFFLMHDRPGDFYIGADGQLYDTLLAALAGGNMWAKKYTHGRNVYLTPLNAEGEVKKRYNCDTRRNNIYDLEIEGFYGLGYNYDPTDPDDPYSPFPGDNPLEPNPTVPPVNKEEVTIRVKASIAKWKYIQLEYELKKQVK